MIFGYDKEIISILPYRYVEKPFFQIYLASTPSGAIFTDLIALLISIIGGSRCFVLLVKKNNTKRYLLLTLSFIITVIATISITFTRNNYYSVELKNSYKTDIKYIDFDGKRKIGSLKPGQSKWIIYKSNYPNKMDNAGETWRTINFTINKSRQGITVFTEDSMKKIRIPDDNNSPGGILY